MVEQDMRIPVSDVTAIRVSRKGEFAHEVPLEMIGMTGGRLRVAVANDAVDNCVGQLAAAINASSAIDGYEFAFVVSTGE